MANLEIQYPSGATPLSPDEVEGLIPDYITTQGELNELEQSNIQDAIIWLQRRRPAEVLTLSFIFELHKRMFNQVWRWAGHSRRSDKNIGVSWTQISFQLALLIEDTRFWIKSRTFPMDEIAVRFHHRLVQIHLFPNGNGRHARLMTDLLLEDGGHSQFSWGTGVDFASLEAESPRRKRYINALRLADQNQYELLLLFVRS